MSLKNADRILQSGNNIMNCWEILGIDPTRDRDAIDRAYEQQKKFADGADLDRLQQAYQEASGDAPEPADSSPQGTGEDSQTASQPPRDAELSAEEQQVVREVVIQVKALLNDSRRAADDGIWRAILAEPPADQPHLRAAVAQSLEAQVRPMADNGSFPPPVVAFLGDWFGWQELLDSGRHAPHPSAESVDHTFDDNEAAPLEGGRTDESNEPGVTNFWPAVVGWVVALAVLGMVFDSIFGG